jgi:hypothetical protein
MLGNISLGLLVLGGVLLLIGFLGGNFKLFGAEVAATISNRFLRLAAIIFGAVLVFASLAGSAPPNPDQIPSGNYQLTCPNRSVNGETLTASCYDNESKLQESSLVDFKRCTFGIENDNGKLVCRLDR